MLYGTSLTPEEKLRLQQQQFGFQQEQAMAPYQLGQAKLGLEGGRFRFDQERAMAPYELEQSKLGLQQSQLGLQQSQLGLERGKFGFEQERAMAPYEMRGLQAQTGMSELGLERGKFGLEQERAIAPYELGQARTGLIRSQFEFGQRREMAPIEMDVARLGLERGRSELDEYRAEAGLRGMRRQLEGAQTSIGLARIGDIGRAGQRAYTFGQEEEELGRLRMAAEARRLQGQMSFQPQMEAIRSGIMGRMARNLGVGLPRLANQYSSGTGYTPSWVQNYRSPQFPS